MPDQPRSERRTQNRIIALFTDEAQPGCLGYRYLSGWYDRKPRPHMTLTTKVSPHVSPHETPYVSPHVGEVIRLFGHCREVGLSAPEFSVSDGFTAILRRPVRPESQPESLAQRVLAVLGKWPQSKAQIAAALRHKAVSGQLNKIILELLASGTVEYTLTKKPNSRMQAYRLTNRSRG